MNPPGNEIPPDFKRQPPLRPFPEEEDDDEEEEEGSEEEEANHPEPKAIYYPIQQQPSLPSISPTLSLRLSQPLGEDRGGGGVGGPLPFHPVTFTFSGIKREGEQDRQAQLAPVPQPPPQKKKRGPKPKEGTRYSPLPGLEAPEMNTSAAGKRQKKKKMLRPEELGDDGSNPEDLGAEDPDDNFEEYPGKRKPGRSRKRGLEGQEVTIKPPKKPKISKLDAAPHTPEPATTSPFFPPSGARPAFPGMAGTETHENGTHDSGVAHSSPFFPQSSAQRLGEGDLAAAGKNGVPSSLDNVSYGGSEIPVSPAPRNDDQASNKEYGGTTKKRKVPNNWPQDFKPWLWLDMSDESDADEDSLADQEIYVKWMQQREARQRKIIQLETERHKLVEPERKAQTLKLAQDLGYKTKLCDGFKLKTATFKFKKPKPAQPAPRPPLELVSFGSVPESAEEEESRRTAVWSRICKTEIPQAAKAMQTFVLMRNMNLKKIAQLAQREMKKFALASTRKNREVPFKSKKISKEMITFWRKNEKEEREMRKRAEKEEMERRKKEEEIREARRQQRKLNFLITQTELYSHFISKKITEDEDNEAHKPSTSAGAEKPKPHVDEALREEAEKVAKSALALTAEKVKTFDDEARKRRMEATGLNQDEFDSMGFDFTAPSTMTGSSEVKQPTILRCQLKPYQLKGLNWLYNLYEQGINGILADEMGLGKTVQSISLIACLAETQNIWGPFLVVAPASTLHNWQQELTKFVPDFKVLPYWGSQNERKVLRKFWSQKQLYSKEAAFHVLVTSYQLIVSDEKYFQRIKWQYMILDEAQALKSSSSVRWNSLLKFNCRNRLLLTGTPIQNTMQELWALLHFIMPTLFDSHAEFSEWFSKDIESHAQGEGSVDRNQLSRLHMILKPFMLRRVKKDVENELGDKIEIDISCELTPRQRRMYRGVKEKISFEDLLQKSVMTEEDTTRLMNLVMQFRKVCNHPELFERRDIVSPFFFYEVGWHRFVTSSPLPSAKDKGILPVTQNCQNPIALELPRLCYSSPVLEKKTRLLSNTLNIFTPFHVHSSLKGAHSTFSFTRFTDLSPAQVATAYTSPVLQRWEDEISSRRPFYQDVVYDENCPEYQNVISRRRARFLVTKTSTLSPHQIETSPILKDLTSIWERTKIIPKTSNAYVQLVRALPVTLYCNDRRFVNEQVQANEKSEAAILFGLRTLSKGRRAPETPLQTLLPGGIVASPLLQHGFTSIVPPEIEKLVTDSGKMKSLDDLLPKLKSEGHRVLIYCQMTKMIDLMEEYMAFKSYKYLRLDGSSKISDRRDMVADFNSNTDIFCFLLSTRAGGLGINLTSADTVIFYEVDWNPTADQQAMDRVHRLGQTKQVTVYRMITRGSVEEKILQRAKQKHEIQKVVISGGDFKATGEFGNSNEIVSLILDEEEFDERLKQQQREKVLLEEAKKQKQRDLDAQRKEERRQKEKDKQKAKELKSERMKEKWKDRKLLPKKKKATEGEDASSPAPSKAGSQPPSLAESRPQTPSTEPVATIPSGFGFGRNSLQTGTPEVIPSGDDVDVEDVDDPME